ncbi:Ig-like domain-containing protein [Actinoplanes sp. NBC_00393]|uniref:Ig-like domain-containing protein n=1 Tax=Actinoplanes sp. NBC_00393 TaxID=2975953 RepID=UPI002E20A221
MGVLRGAAIAAFSISLVLGTAALASADEADTQGPTVQIRWGVPAAPNVIGKGFQTLQTDISDPSGVDQVSWFVDGALRSHDRYLHYDFGATQRTAEIELWATDVEGNQTVTKFPVTVDATPPKLTAVKPAANSRVRGKPVTATITLSDLSRDMYVIPESNLAKPLRAAPWTAKFPIYDDGRYRLGWWVYDAWGNQAVVYQSLVADNTGPKLTVTKAPKNKAKVKGTVKVTATASDAAGVARVELLINGKVVARDVKSAYQFSINTKKYGKTIKVRLRAYDRLGNVTATSVRTWHR